MMRAAVAQGLNQPLSVETIDDPTPSVDGVVVKVGRCGICGSDLHMTEDPAFGLQAGDVLGHEFAGEVVALGREVTNLRVGDRVSVSPLSGCGACSSCQAGEFAWCSQFGLQGGGYAEYAATTARQCLRLPSDLSLADGAIVEPLAVALHGVALSGVKPGDSVLVLGAGPIGLATAFWARRAGAKSVVVQDIAAYQEERARSMGATDYIVDRDDPVGASDRALNGKADLVFECVGLPGLIAQAVEQVRVKGTIVVLGLCSKPDSWTPFTALSKEIRLQTSAFFLQSEYEAALDALHAGAAEPRALVSGEVSLSDTPDIFESLRARTHHCKVLISPFAD